MSAGQRKAPVRSGADAKTTNQPPGAYPSHETYMHQVASRIRWLERHEPWWLRTSGGRSQLEFIERRDAA